MKQSQIGLLDCNNFFVSCERVFRPDLEGKPVLVLSANDGCVVARSQEVKDMGIPMGIPLFQIKDIVKDNGIQVFSGNLTLYRDFSQRVFSIVREHFSMVEQYSVDEAFFVFDQTDRDNVGPDLEKLKKEVKKQVGIPVSIGVGYSKTQAKCAADIAKKSTGVYIVPEVDKVLAFGENKLETVWGIGPGMSKKYRAQGLHNVSDLQQADTERVGRLFGVAGTRKQAELRGISVDICSHKRPLQKSIMSSKSFAKTTTDRTILEDAAAYHVRHSAAELRAMGAVAGVLRISLHTSRHSDYFMRGGSKEFVFTIPTSDSIELIQAAVEGVLSLYESCVPYTKVGITLSEIQAVLGSTYSLFETSEASTAKDRKKLLAVVDVLNKTTAGELVTIGSRLRTRDWRSQSNSRSNRYTTAWSEIKTVSA